MPLCPHCGQGHFHTFAEGYDYELQTSRNKWRFVECDACSNAWLNPRPALPQLGGMCPSNSSDNTHAAKITTITGMTADRRDATKVGAVTSHAHNAQDTVPRAVLGVILFLTGAQLALGSCDFSKNKGERFITLATAAFAMWNVGLAFVAGITLTHIAKRGLLRL